MFKFILTGCDSSVHTRGAVALARVLLDADGELELACVYPHGGSLDRAGQYAGVLEDDANVTLADVVAHVPAGIEVRTRALPGTSPARALTEEAEATGADLVVLGSTHHGPVGRIVLGSTAQRMLHGAPCAVAVAPKAYDGGPIGRIGVAYDGSAEAGAALERAYAVARETGAAVTLYTAVEPAHFDSRVLAGAANSAAAIERYAHEHAKELLRGAADRAPAGVDAERVVVVGRPGATIADHANRAVDLLVVGSRGYGPLRRTLLGSVSGALIAHAGIPVLVVPRTAAARAATADAAADAAAA